MKKLFLAVVLVALTGSAFAQTKADVRKEKREARVEQTIAQLKAAVVGQNFTFIPTTMMLAYKDPINLGSTSMTPFVDIAPGDMTVNLPFSMQMFQPNSKVFDLYLPGVPYTYSVKQGQGNTYNIVMNLTNVSNQGGFKPSISTQNINLGIHLSVDVRSGYATMTVTPDFGAPTVYTGTIAPN